MRTALTYLRLRLSGARWLVSCGDRVETFTDESNADAFASFHRLRGEEPVKYRMRTLRELLRRA